MASSQQVANISEENRAILCKLKNDIKASNGGVNLNAQSQATTTMNMSNMGVGQMIVHDNYNWSGNVLGIYPTINAMDTRNFMHRGIPPKDPQGSYGCVIYAGPNVQGGAINCAWVLAWKVLGDGSPNKVIKFSNILCMVHNKNWLFIIVSLTINVCISDLRGNWSAYQIPERCC